jgi:hypothetical protein
MAVLVATLNNLVKLTAIQPHTSALRAEVDLNSLALHDSQLDSA